MEVAQRKKILFNYQDICSWETDQYRHELIEGEHIMSPSPTPYHQDVTFNLGFYLKKYIMENDLGKLYIAPTDVVFHEMDVFVPDLFFIKKQNLHIIRDSYIDGVPDIIIEVLSPSSKSRDRDMKFKRYAYYAVPEYWIVDPDRQIFEVYDLISNELYKIFPRHQKLNTPTFPDLNMDLNLIF